MTWSEEENRRLAGAVQEALATLHRLASSLERGDVHYAVHDEFLDRVLSLERYLATAIAAVNAGNHAPGFALLRSALEHHLVDHLLMRGRRRIRRGRKISQETFDRWWASWKGGEEGYEHIVDMQRNDKGSVRIVDEAIRVNDEHGVHEYSLSIYYAYFNEFDPLVGPPSEQEHLDHPWLEVDEQREIAREQRRLYEAAMRWKSIRDHLEVNEFYSVDELLQLNVHYRFLSAFVHPTPTGDKILQWHHSSYVPIYERDREHIAWELGHLYAAALATREIHVFLEMASDRPRVSIRDHDAIVRAARIAREQSARLWFVGDDPHPYDLEMRRLRASRRRCKGSDDDGVLRYYPNPYDRLAGLHRSRWQQ